MLTLPSTPELESRLQKEAAKHGLPAGEYAVRLIEGLLKPEHAGDVTEQVRLAAIDELMGAGADSPFSSAEFRREHNAEQEGEEERHLRRFKLEQAP